MVTSVSAGLEVCWRAEMSIVGVETGAVQKVKQQTTTTNQTKKTENKTNKQIFGKPRCLTDHEQDMFSIHRSMFSYKHAWKRKVKAKGWPMTLRSSGSEVVETSLFSGPPLWDGAHLPSIPALPLLTINRVRCPLTAGWTRGHMHNLFLNQTRNSWSQLCHYISPIVLSVRLQTRIEKRISYKINRFCYKCINCFAPTYLCDHLRMYTPVRPLHSASDTVCLRIPRYRCSTTGRHSFSVCGPYTWNELPLSLRQSQTLSSSTTNLKTYLFVQQWFPPSPTHPFIPLPSCPPPPSMHVLCTCKLILLCEWMFEWMMTVCTLIWFIHQHLVHYYYYYIPRCYVFIKSKSEHFLQILNIFIVCYIKYM